MDISHISVSRRKCYQKCPQQYKFHYHLRTPSPLPEPPYFVYGTIIHRIAEEYVRAGGEKTVGQISQDLLRGKILFEEGNEKCPGVPSTHKNKFQKHLRAIQKLTERIGFDNGDGELEWEFKYDLDPPNEKNLVGFVDRLIIKQGKAFIIDYKTTKKSKWRVNKSTVKQDLQLRCYARMVQKKFGIAPNDIKAALFFVEGEELVAAKYSEASLALVEQELLDAYREIEDADPDKVWASVGFKCKTCDYQSICPFYQSSPSQKPDVAWDGDLSNLPVTG